MENNITNEHSMHLKDQLRQLGLPYKLHEQIDYYQQMDILEFTLPHWIPENGSLTLIELHYKPDTQNLSVLDTIDISYRPPIEIKDRTVGDINTKELDEKMASINWTYDHFSERIVDEDMKTASGRKMLDHVSETLHQLDQLHDNKIHGDKETAQLLMYKHWTSGYYSRFVEDLSAMKKLYEYSRSIKVDGQNISIQNIIEQLKEQYKISVQQKLPVKRELPDKTIGRQTRKRGQSL
ncbi:MAG: hypothetical protein BGO69_05565 [Bacteroidetes bacterium 46-16]|mgnify:CR=1 FL=1|nr:MAG: hypothetical protein BGO69_05565 [Bacteroidetes bacterium 46-16]